MRAILALQKLITRSKKVTTLCFDKTGQILEKSIIKSNNKKEDNSLPVPVLFKQKSSQFYR